MVYSIGPMEKDIKDNGNRIKQVDKENYTFQMEIYLLDNFLINKQMDQENILLQMEQFIKVNGRQMFK